MSDFGGMLSFEVRGGQRRGDARSRRGCKLFTRATSLGGVGEPDRAPRVDRRPGERDAPKDLLRVSVGLEHPDDLIEDLAQALERCH